MLLKIPSEDIYVGDYDWHVGRFHFSFGDYDDPENIQFGILKALNDFELKPSSGFETHPHDEMEIISYCVEGELTHRDVMGNKNTIKRGDVQYLCAGSGITHSEMNGMPDLPLRFLQIWILPNESKLNPTYRSENFSKVSSMNELFQVASGEATDGAIQISQDANIYVAGLEKGKQLAFTNHYRRQCYLVCLEGQFTANGIELNQRDAMKIWGEDFLTLTALEESQLLMVEMANERNEKE